jgi:hypothetical protein
MTSKDTGHTCQCRHPHRPEPLVLDQHHILPIEYGGPSVPSNQIWLCPTTHYNVHEILRGMVSAGRVLTWGEVHGAQDRHPVSRYAYDVAADGMNRYLAKGT